MAAQPEVGGHSPSCACCSGVRPLLRSECRAHWTQGGAAGCRANTNQQPGPVGTVATTTPEALRAESSRRPGGTAAVRCRRRPAGDSWRRRRGCRGAAAQWRINLKMSEPRDVCKLSRDWLNVQEVVDAVSRPSCGAISVFIGVTREDVVENRKVIGLEYEAYESMVQSEFTKLCADIRARWPDVAHICVHHRLGWVKVGDASVAMAISSPHRQDAQQAVTLCISRLKATIPIWKKEVYDTHETSWKENAECLWAGPSNQRPITSSAENQTE